jgi:ribosomal protein S18 acetylase RimI-like enzyme
MIALLAELGSVALETTECSLFVYTDNERARRFYERLGFISKAIPEREPDVPNCDYMVASVEILKR